MRIFEILKRNLQLLGILRYTNGWKSILNSQQINVLQCSIIFSIQIFYFLSTLWFFLFSAKQFDEFIDGFLFVSSSALHLTLYTVLIYQKGIIKILMDKLNVLIQQSKFITNSLLAKPHVRNNSKSFSFFRNRNPK